MAERRWLDTSAILSWVFDEPGGEQVEAALMEADTNGTTLLASEWSRVEVVYGLVRHDHETWDFCWRIVRDAPLEWVALSEEESVAAGQLRAEYKMSTADSAIVTQAAAHGCELWHKDPEFDSLPKNFVKVKRLPYKKRRKK